MAFGFEHINDFPKINRFKDALVKFAEKRKKKKEEEDQKEKEEINEVYQQAMVLKNDLNQLKSSNATITKEDKPEMKKVNGTSNKEGNAPAKQNWMSRKDTIRFLRWLDAYKASGEDEADPLRLEELQKKASDELGLSISIGAAREMAHECNVNYRYKQVNKNPKKAKEDKIAKQIEAFTKTREFEIAVLRVLEANHIISKV